jgi:hypothetical protein
MRLVLKRDWDVIDAAHLKHSARRNAVIPKGVHEVERIPNPLGHPGAPWLVLKGTLIGATEGSWRQWRNGTLNARGEPIDWGDFEVVVEE